MNNNVQVYVVRLCNRNHTKNCNTLTMILNAHIPPASQAEGNGKQQHGV